MVEVKQIIIRTDYREFEYCISPKTDEEDLVLKEVHPKVERYFVNKNINCAHRTEYDRSMRRYYMIRFEDVDDANMFRLALAEHITHLGRNFD